MRVQSVVLWIAVLGTLTSSSHRVAIGQQLTLAARTPRFFYASSTTAKPVEIDVNHAAVLGRVVSLRMEHTTLGGVLADIQRQTGLTFAHDPRFPATRAVALEAESITVGAALGAILVGTDMDVVLTPTGHVWLTESNPPAPRVQEGTIIGRVTDKLTSDPIMGATVTLDPSGQAATSATDGRYQFVNLAPGGYRVRARYIGYTSLVASVAVTADQEARVDFPLERSAQQLEQVVTTGSLVPTEVKALPTPVSVVTDKDIELQRPRNVQELFRQVIPGSASWDQPQGPGVTTFAVRGASTLVPGGGQMKVFVDGIEVANAGLAPIDPNSIERMEVIRGPQAAAIYGSQAIGGVIQIFTKRGDPNLTRPQVSAEAALGLIQTPYTDLNGVLRQDYKASVRGTGTDMSYNIGAGYSHTDDWLPNGEISKQSNPSVYGGMHFSRGMLTVDASGRYDAYTVPGVFNPVLYETGFPFFSKPNYRSVQTQNQTAGFQLGVVPRPWWQHKLTAGIDRWTSETEQLQPRLTTPADTLLTLQNILQTKRSIGYNTSVQGSLSSGVFGSVTAGLDHWSLPVNSWFTSGAHSTTGTITTVPSQPVSASRSTTTNTGYFVQSQVGFRDALFLTAGMRAEQNSDFGDSLGTPLSPRLGLSYVQQLGGANLKFRGSWGRAIRPPTAGLKLAAVSPLGVTLANPDLAPERQQGWDAGVDAAFGSRGWLSVTYYRQTADNLIQTVIFQTAPLVQQNQNVGRVKNTGIEVEGALSLGMFQLKGTYGYAKSRIEQLSPTYTGDLRVGDQSQFTPKHTAGGSLALLPHKGTTIVTGLTYVGSWTGADQLAISRCGGQTGPCQPTTRDYVISYPSFVKVNASIAQQITSVISAFASVSNLTNNEAYEFNNFRPVMGRITTVGLGFRY